MSDSSPQILQNDAAYARGEVPFWTGARGQRVSVSGGTIHYVELGDPAAPPVMLMHKLGGWAADWRAVAERLAVDHRVLVVDAPGHGGSQLHKEITWAHPITASSAMVAEFLDALGIDRLHLMGASLGGVISTQLASEQPERVLTLALVGVSLTGRQSLELTLENDRAVRDMFTDDWTPLPFPVDPGLSGRELATATAQNASRAQVGRWARASERGFGLIGIEQRLEFITAPVLLLNGVSARYRKYEDTARRLLGNVRVETMEIAGMFPHQEDPDETELRWRSFTDDAA
ncbi:alpha/beta fold hydrolase [uncultured Microbacterium sp.]|uniref:alpha/beta fold hydrolase n=1 Tax=uncultured Microbacterium sp. TaxID=191216 RepID=UPI002638CA74|nr:alpha/beta hydrolase [uncultured Microbacterium sp.]